jgi:hypothetical protein
MKKLITIVSLLFLLTPIFAQEVDDAQLFGSSRGMNYYSSFSKPDIQQNQFTHTFIIRNTAPTDIEIISATLPQGISILIPQKNIKANSQGKIIATVYKNYIEQDSSRFAKEFTIVAKLNFHNGVTETKQYKFLISGNFK